MTTAAVEEVFVDCFRGDSLGSAAVIGRTAVASDFKVSQRFVSGKGEEENMETCFFSFFQFLNPVWLMFVSFRFKTRCAWRINHPDASARTRNLGWCKSCFLSYIEMDYRSNLSINVVDDILKSLI